MTKVKTINLKGNEYAKVPERIRQFREDCPNGKIETEPTIQEDGQVVFKAYVIKDQSKPESATATGHALGKNTGDKSFERLETIAVGRALAMLGYLASGEVASAEEMEEFLAYREEKIEEEVSRFMKAKDIAELKKLFVKSEYLTEKRVIEAKNKRKAELEQEDGQDT